MSWCNLSSKQWSDKSHNKEMLLTNNLMKQSLKNQKINKKMTSYEKNIALKRCYLILFQLRTKFFFTVYRNWINERIEYIFSLK